MDGISSSESARGKKICYFDVLRRPFQTPKERQRLVEKERMDAIDGVFMSMHAALGGAIPLDQVRVWGTVVRERGRKIA